MQDPHRALGRAHEKQFVQFGWNMIGLTFWNYMEKHQADPNRQKWSFNEDLCRCINYLYHHFYHLVFAKKQLKQKVDLVWLTV